MPTNNLYKIFKNLEALSDGEGGDPAKIIMRLFNFSEYQIYNEEERAENRKEMMKGVNERTRDRMRKEGKIGPKKKKTTKKKKKNTKPKSNGNPMEMINPMESDNPMSQDNPMDSDNPMLDDNPME
jgi:hypothetical protein